MKPEIATLGLLDGAFLGESVHLNKTRLIAIQALQNRINVIMMHENSIEKSTGH